MWVTRQPVVQPHLEVHHGQGRLGRHGVKEVQRVQHEVAERHGADCTALDFITKQEREKRMTSINYCTFHNSLCPAPAIVGFTWESVSVETKGVKNLQRFGGVLSGVEC